MHDPNQTVADAVWGLMSVSLMVSAAIAANIGAYTESWHCLVASVILFAAVAMIARFK